MIIGICDDDKIWERKASYIIGEYRKKASLDIDIQYFPDKEGSSAIIRWRHLNR